MKTKIYFVRHAEPIHSHQEDSTRPLTQEGLKDREKIVETLKDIEFQYCISSPYKRCVDTITPLAEIKGLDVALDYRFRERKSGNGNTKELIRKRWSDFEFCENGGENLRQVQHRNMEGLKQLIHDHKGETILFGTHGTALSTIENYYDKNFGFDDFWRMIDFMPYIILYEFESEKLVNRKEIFILKKEFKG